MATTPPSMPCKSASLTCWAMRRPCSCPPARKAICAASWPIASAATSTSSASLRTPTVMRVAVQRCWAASSRSRCRSTPPAKWRWLTSPMPSNPTTVTSPAPGFCAWKTPGVATPCPWTTWRRPRPWHAGMGWQCTWTARDCSTRQRPAQSRARAWLLRHVALPATLTACRCALARAWARRWVRRCAVAKSSLPAPTACAR